MAKSKKVKLIPLKVTVKVTQEHINKGKTMDGYFCPIALSLKAQGFKGVSVPGGVFSVKVGKFELNYLLPKKAIFFIYDFDGEGRVKPFTFTAELSKVDNPSRYDE